MLGLGNTLSGGITPTAVDTAFTFTINTENAGSATKTFVLPLVSDGTINFTVEWGDDQEPDTITAYNQSEITHVYSSTGTYTVKLEGTIRGWKFDNSGDKLKIIDISNWGDFNFTKERGFRGCTNLTCSATDAPTVSSENMSFTFRNCVNFNGVVDSWDMSSVTDIQQFFYNCDAFNQPLNSWDVSNVTTLKNMFYGTAIFNQPLSNWNTSNVTDLTYTFGSALQFNQDLNDWDTSNVTKMERTFNYALSYDQSVSNWDIESVTDFTSIFQTTTLSTANYDAILIAWDAQNPNDGEAVHFGNATYTAGGTAAAARQNLIDTDSWTITDGGTA